MDDIVSWRYNLRIGRFLRCPDALMCTFPVIITSLVIITFSVVITYRLEASHSDLSALCLFIRVVCLFVFCLSALYVLCVYCVCVCVCDV